MEKLTIIITGVTGMIGEGLLHQCLQHEEIGKVISITRRPSGYTDPRLTEIIHEELSDISGLTIDLTDCDACFYCIGTTTFGKEEEQYKAENYALPLNFASGLARINPNLTFCYISGMGADSSEKGRVMWARIKGKTENDLMKLPFKAVYNFRPAALIPFLPLNPSQTYYSSYKYLKWLMPALKPLFPNYIMDLRVMTAAMINAAIEGYPKNILEPKDIRKLGSAAA